MNAVYKISTFAPKSLQAALFGGACGAAGVGFMLIWRDTSNGGGCSGLGVISTKTALLSAGLSSGSGVGATS